MYPVRKEGEKKQVSSPWGAEKQLEATERSKNKNKNKKPQSFSKSHGWSMVSSATER